MLFKYPIREGLTTFPSFYCIMKKLVLILILLSLLVKCISCKKEIEKKRGYGSFSFLLFFDNVHFLWQCGVCLKNG